MALAPRVVVVHRRTELDELLARHGTRQQAEFFVRGRGQDLAGIEARHHALTRALTDVSAVIPRDWRRGTVERADLDRFLFAPEDVVVVVGQDGLVANVAKYLDGQPVIGLDPEPGRNLGVLVPHPVTACGDLLAATISGTARCEWRTMVEAATDDGRRLLALNEVYIGHPSHQSARYRLIAPDGTDERQSSSGLIAGTGSGATGWCRSAWLERGSDLRLPARGERRLAWFVREAWPSPATGATLTEGSVTACEKLSVSGEADGLVAFGDGVEIDRLELTFGQLIELRVADRRLQLVR